MKNLLLISLLTLVLSGCRDIHCPAFPERLLAYMPYEKGDLLKFKNLANDTLVIIVNDNWKSNSYSSKRDPKCGCECESQAEFKTEANQPNSLRIEGGMATLGSDYITIGFNFYDTELGSDQLSKAIHGLNPFAENSPLFGDSIIIEDQENERIAKVKILKGKGIVEFFDKKENCTWVRIE